MNHPPTTNAVDSCRFFFWKFVSVSIFGSNLAIEGYISFCLQGILKGTFRHIRIIAKVPVASRKEKQNSICLKGKIRHLNGFREMGRCSFFQPPYLPVWNAMWFALVWLFCLENWVEKKQSTGSWLEVQQKLRWHLYDQNRWTYSKNNTSTVQTNLETKSKWVKENHSTQNLIDELWVPIVFVFVGVVQLGMGCYLSTVLWR